MAKKLVVFVGRADWAGSCNSVVRAINKVGRVECRHVCLNKHIYGYPTDVVIPICYVENPKRAEDYPEELKQANELFERADVIHLWNDPLPNFGGLINIPAEKVSSYTFTGSLYREYHTQINEHAKESGIKMVVQDPTFRFPHEIESEFIPHAVDTDLLQPRPMEQREAKTIGCYTPLHRSTTARQDIALLKTVLSEEFSDWRTTMGEVTLWQPRMEALSKCMFFFQNMDEVVGIFGRSALEAAALGVPTFSFISRKALEMSDGRIGDPAIIHTSRETVREVLKETLSGDYRQLSDKIRQWVVDYYSFPVIGEHYTKYFEELLNRPADKKVSVVSKRPNNIGKPLPPEHQKVSSKGVSMPTSSPDQINEILQLVLRLKPESILDIGVGFGKYGFLCREYLDNGFGAEGAGSNRKRIDGIEINDKYITSLQKQIYDNLHIGQAKDILPKLDKYYDVILLVNVLEYLPKEEGLELIKLCRDRGRNVIVSTLRKPADEFTGLYGHEYAGIKSIWNEKDFDSYPHRQSIYNPLSLIMHLDNATAASDSGIQLKLIHREEDWKNGADPEIPQTKIFITGCAKSGTTLLLRLFLAFDQTAIIVGPIPTMVVDKILFQKGPIVFKRLGASIFSNNITLPELDRQAKKLKESDVRVINIVRDGRDVVTSDKNFTKPDRWIASIKHRSLYPDLIDLEVKYEDLVSDPDKVQKQIMDKFGLKKNFNFSDYPDFIPDDVYDPTHPKIYGGRKISPKSVGKDLQAYKQLCDEPTLVEFERLLQQLDYLKPEPEKVVAKTS